MVKKFALNIFYTLGLILSGFGIVWASQNSNWYIVAVLVAAAVFFLYLKIQLLKEVKNAIKK